jgi:hypothetical protein
MKLIEGEDFTIDEQSGLMVLTVHFLLKRGYCCGKNCKNCPYEPKGLKGNDVIKKELKDNENI